MSLTKIFLVVLVCTFVFVVIIFWDKIKIKEANIKIENNISQNNMTNAPKDFIRRPQVAGQFYPQDPEVLKEEIKNFLSKEKPIEYRGEIIALILPHAGYQFSGLVAAAGFRNLIKEDIETVILIGNSHHQYFKGVSIYPRGYFETPLGKIEIDSDLAEELMKQDPDITFMESAHLNEHSLEVQLPFLQMVLKNFKIVPILFGNNDDDYYKILSDAILKTVKGKNVLIIASSDLSHYPSYKDANYADKKTIDSILTGDFKKLEDTINNLKEEQIPNALTFACAEDAIKTTMMVARGLGANEIKLLKYANSGDVYSDRSQVVGYAAIGFFAPRRGNLLNKKEKEILLDIAKKSVEGFLLDGKIPSFDVKEEMLNKNLGAFVTLKKDGSLRGCIGTFSPASEPLYKVVSQMALSAAFKDPRFYPVKKEELKEIQYEISVLSELKGVNDFRKINLGRDGVEIVLDGRSRVFLPQVATENNLGLEEFLELLCEEKLGLDKTCYKDPGAKIYTFTAQVF